MTMSEKTVCPYASRCGGCAYQGVSYAKQLRLKQEKLEKLFGKYVKPLPIIGMEDPYGYRHKVQYAFARGRDKQILCGMYEPSTHDIVPVERCLINNEKADEVVHTIRSLMPKYKLTAYDEVRETGFLRHVLIRAGYATGELMVVLVGTSGYFANEKHFVKELTELHPEIKTVVLNVNDAYTSMVLGKQNKVLFGDGYIRDELCGLTFRISPSSFYQVNPEQAEKLYRTAIEFAGLTGKETVLDAYCGTGTIGIACASRARSVTGVELNNEAVRDAIRNAKLNGAGNCWFECADAGQFLQSSGFSPDVVIMDPPRTGADHRFLSSLLRSRPKKIVYVSCGPDSLARDIAQLVKGGYRVKKIQPVDMFPFTEHVESVVLMSRAGS